MYGLMKWMNEMTVKQKVKLFDATECSTDELIAYRNLADFESKTIVVGDSIFNAILPKVKKELKRRGIK